LEPEGILHASGSPLEFVSHLQCGTADTMRNRTRGLITKGYCPLAAYGQRFLVGGHAICFRPSPTVNEQDDKFDV